VFRTGGWILIGYALALILRLLGNLIMTRIFVPDVFGIMAIATVVQVIISLLSDIGLFQAIIQSPNGEKPSLLNTAWTVQALRGCLIWAACIAVAVGLLAANTWGWLPPSSVYANPVLPAVILASHSLPSLGIFAR
jgi:O-antigen/teichoic acid export membrane protein